MTRASDTARLLGAGGTFGGAITSNSGIAIDDITIDGTEIDLSGSGDFSVDVGGDIILDADSRDIKLQDGGTDWGLFQRDTSTVTSSFVIKAMKNDSDIKFKGVDNNSEITAMTIDMSEGGNVGIGNTNPSSFNTLADNLVVGTTSGENGITIASGTGNSGRFVFSDNTTSSNDAFVGAIEYSHGNDAMTFYTVGSPRMTILSTGGLDMQGVYDITTVNGANVNVASDGLIRRSTSSLRYKNTVTDATHGLAELLKLRSVTYKGNNEGDTIFGGLIAEEVHDAGLTEFVQYNDDNEPDALSYGNMVSLCIKAIQELKAENTALANRITALEGE